jgi:hypothetical protein
MRTRRLRSVPALLVATSLGPRDTAAQTSTSSWRARVEGARSAPPRGIIELSLDGGDRTPARDALRTLYSHQPRQQAGRLAKKYAKVADRLEKLDGRFEKLVEPGTRQLVRRDAAPVRRVATRRAWA